MHQAPLNNGKECLTMRKGVFQANRKSKDPDWPAKSHYPEHQNPSEKSPTVKENNLLSRGSNYFHFSKGRQKNFEWVASFISVPSRLILIPIPLWNAKRLAEPSWFLIHEIFPIYYVSVYRVFGLFTSVLLSGVTFCCWNVGSGSS